MDAVIELVGAVNAGVVGAIAARGYQHVEENNPACLDGSCDVAVQPVEEAVAEPAG